MMELKKCAKCGRFFSSSGDLCSKCAVKDIYDLSTVKHFISSNPDTDSLDILSASTGIPSKNIIRYISNGRLDDMTASTHLFRCVSCNTPISKGTYCTSCLSNRQAVK